MDEEAQSPTSKLGVRRPMNAFLIFCKRHRSLVRERNSHLDNRSVTRILGELWAKLPPEEKSTYTSLANEYKEAFLKANPDYKWFNPEKNTSPGSRDKPSTRPSNSLTSYTGQVPHTDDAAPLSPTQGAVSSQLSTLVMEHSKQTAIPLSTSLASPQEGASLTQGIPIFPIGVATQPLTLAQTLPVSTMPPAMSTLAMVGGQPMVVTQTPMIVSLPQQAQIPVSIVTTGAMATTALSADLLSTQKLGLPALPALPHSNADPHSTTLLELAKMCTTERETSPSKSVNFVSVSRAQPTLGISQPHVLNSGSQDMQCSSAAPMRQEHTPQIDSKALQGQVKEALGFQPTVTKPQVVNLGLNQALDYSLRKDKDCEAGQLQKCTKQSSTSTGRTYDDKNTHQSDLSKLVLESVIEAMYSRETAKAPVQNPGSAEQAHSRKLMLTFGEIQEQVIRSAVESDDLTRASKNNQSPHRQDLWLPEKKCNATTLPPVSAPPKPHTSTSLTSDANKENNLKTQLTDSSSPCDPKPSIPAKKRHQKSRDSKSDLTDSDKTPDDTQSSADDLENDSQDLNDLDPGVRKSKRCNRGRRYQELIEQGYLQPARDRPVRKTDDPTTAYSHSTSVHDLTPDPVKLTSDVVTVTSDPVKVTFDPVIEKSESEAGNAADGDPRNEVHSIGDRSNSISLGTPSDDQQYYSRKRTYSETDIGKRHTRRRYKTGDFDLEAHIASLPVCQIDEVSRRGFRIKGVKVRHHSENSTLNKFAKPADINLLNVAELRGVLRPRSKSMTHASVGSARRKAPKMSIVRFIQAVRAPNSSTVPLLSPVSASGIAPWSEWSKTAPSEPHPPTGPASTTAEPQAGKTPAANQPPGGFSETKHQGALGGVTCVNMGTLSSISNINRFEKSTEQQPTLVTCQ